MENQHQIIGALRSRWARGWIACIFVLWGPAGGAQDTSERLLEIQTNVLNVRAAPDRNAPVVRKLSRGAVVIELERLPDWVKITYRNDRNRKGWVAAAFVKPVSSSSPAQVPVAAGSKEFDNFVRAYDALSARFLAVTGESLFSDVRNEGYGILSVIATEYWGSGTAAQRTSDARTVLRLWQRANHGRAVSLHVYDKAGRKQMSIIEVGD